MVPGQAAAEPPGSFSSRVDVPPPEGFQPLASYKIANNYREFMTNDKLVADLRKRFEGYTGPPANKGGVKRHASDHPEADRTARMNSWLDFGLWGSRRVGSPTTVAEGYRR